MKEITFIYIPLLCSPLQLLLDITRLKADYGESLMIVHLAFFSRSFSLLLTSITFSIVISPFCWCPCTFKTNPICSLIMESTPFLFPNPHLQPHSLPQSISLCDLSGITTLSAESPCHPGDTLKITPLSTSKPCTAQIERWHISP